jgi:hypothetical protein
MDLMTSPRGTPAIGGGKITSVGDEDVNSWKIRTWLATLRSWAVKVSPLSQNDIYSGCCRKNIKVQGTQGTRYLD